jgi:phage terminase large subunit
VRLVGTAPTTSIRLRQARVLSFFGVDSPDKVRGPRRDILYMNEANNTPLDAFDHLEVRTKKEIWLDWVPSSEYWWYTDVAPYREHSFITLTYLDNEGLEPEIVKSIESRKHNENWWRVYGLGQMGIQAGQIYTNWETIARIPKSARRIRHTIVLANIVRKYERLPAAEAAHRYDGGITHTLTVADSAEPKSIAEMNTYGVNITGATKAPTRSTTASRSSRGRSSKSRSTASTSSRNCGTTSGRSTSAAGASTCRSMSGVTGWTAFATA